MNKILADSDLFCIVLGKGIWKGMMLKFYGERTDSTPLTLCLEYVSFVNFLVD